MEILCYSLKAHIRTYCKIVTIIQKWKQLTININVNFQKLTAFKINEKNFSMARLEQVPPGYYPNTLPIEDENLSHQKKCILQFFLTNVTQLQSYACVCYCGHACAIIFCFLCQIYCYLSLNFVMCLIRGNYK